MSCSRTVSPTKWKKPLYLELGEVWSWMNFTLMVSKEHTATAAPAHASSQAAQQPACAVWLVAAEQPKDRLGVER